ncbi:DUF2861 family protein [Scandinavium sp. V105_16]|uniref:DUF2861 family protein n=1 Tax=Scandinavium lactucae TaxID=3095028 RepID=A0AAJ2VZF6_9ENTR|nr:MULTISPECIES: DUF2861 family protein [unclassified Scandinavium]MDX6022235.1 DUF2861 family protein [Scandinavium sp. V105_16]MDX6033923.1 DUF2861 family protein [Scandinavium sp. V105_12]
MRRSLLLPGLVWMMLVNQTAAALPVTPLEPVYHALFSQQTALAWQQLIAVWPQLNSNAQRRAWQEALNAVISAQCGNDIPVKTPAWLDSPTLVLIQRDIPLNRIYRIQLVGGSPARNLQISLIAPNGKDLMLGATAEYYAHDQFQLESQELGEPMPMGVYQLTLRAGSEVWQQSLALQGNRNLNWIQRQGHSVTLLPPETPSACPAPWLEQAMLKGSDYQQIWSLKSDQLQMQPWPRREDASELWGIAAVDREEARGGLTLRLEHRLAGPLLTLQN